MQPRNPSRQQLSAEAKRAGADTLRPHRTVDAVFHVGHRMTHLLVCFCFLIAGCYKQVTVPNPVDGQRISSIRLVTGEEIRIQSPNVGHWEGDSLVVRNRAGRVVETHQREDIAEVKEQKYNVVATVGVAAIAVALVVFIIGGATVDPYSGSD